MTVHRLSLFLAGAAATAVIAFASVIAHGPALVRDGAAARLPVPLGLAMLASLLLVYGAGVGLGWLFWRKRRIA